MGPHSFECGNQPQRPTSQIPTKPGFNGAALVRVRKSADSTPALTEIAELQWGRTRSSAEITQWLPRNPPPPTASMGPHSFECGNVSSAS